MSFYVCISWDSSLLCPVSISWTHPTSECNQHIYIYSITILAPQYDNYSIGFVSESHIHCASSDNPGRGCDVNPKATEFSHDSSHPLGWLSSLLNRTPSCKGSQWGSLGIEQGCSQVTGHLANSRIVLNSRFRIGFSETCRHSLLWVKNEGRPLVPLLTQNGVKRDTIKI